MLAPEGAEDSPASVAGQVRARVYFGHADRDEYLPPDQIARLDLALAAAGVHFQTELFRGALHGWTATDAPSYDMAADALHYARILGLLEETIGGGRPDPIKS